MYSKFFKRLLDIILSLLVIILFSWLYIIVAILVKFKLGSPVIFKQPRPGMNEKVFNMYKFRSMTDERDENGNLLPDEVRLTAFGKKLRATSLDELPEFFNILKGDMSFVGPRPLLVKYLPLYNEEQRHRHDVRPGLTGWAQVNGRNLLSWEDKLEKDVYYVRNISFLFDLKIVLKTIAVVFRHNDINSATNATMEAFTGTKPKQKVE
ncbi:sugar transferase [Butyrivibrio sp. INlla14]|uniref:sugar transferase n=1 Tax=Butyrivibrio sp. INlla14 TaxID=1520808 RepID=UPI0008762184|nr:sugar transferase [Butyrivibrio sp. INlla14]SCY25827.1 Sugar transferase involved in LPS biosynthesis (colanic, teichoic acid) [Butyrivibrio sp. INlla14]